MLNKLVIILLSITILTSQAQTNKISLSWDVSCNTNIFQYVLYYGTNVLATPITNVVSSIIDDCGINRPAKTNVYKGSYTTSINVFGRTNNVVTVTNLVKGVKYYFTITYKAEGELESNPATEVEYTVPLYPTNSIPSRTVGLRVLSVE